MAHRDRASDSSASDSSVEEASASDVGSDASSSNAKVVTMKKRDKKTKKGKVKDKKSKSSKSKSKNKTSKRGPRGAQWMTWDIPFQESSILGQTFQMASKKGGVKVKDLSKFVKKHDGTPAFVIRLLKRGHNRGWTWEADDSHDKLRIMNAKLDKKYRKQAA